MHLVYWDSSWYIHSCPLFGGGPLLGGSVIGGSTVARDGIKRKGYKIGMRYST